MPRNEPIFEQRYPLVFASYQDKAWALHPAKLEEFVALAEALLDGQKLDWPVLAAGKGGPQVQDESYQVRDGVALIPVYGVLDKRMNLLADFSGGTSYEVVGAQLREALADPRVQAILLDVDSPGGSVDGVKTLADQILASRGQKPLVAFANGQMTSAAYWLGSAADQVVAEETAVLGSIGVAMTHFDRSGQDAQRGVKRTLIYSGRYKTMGSDAGPLSAEAQDYLQQISDTYYQLFLDGVGRNRGQDAAVVHAAMGDGRMFIGRQALDVGLVDQIGTLDDALALAKQMAQPGQGRMMMDRKTFESQHPELFVAIKAEGAGEVTLEQLCTRQPEAAAQLRAEGRDGERARVVEILEAAGLKGLLFEVIQDGREPKAAFKAFLAHGDQVRAEALAAMTAAAPPPMGTTPAKVETHLEPPGDAPIETRTKAAWDQDAKLRQEFGGKFETYLAYQRAEESGLAKQIKKG